MKKRAVSLLMVLLAVCTLVFLAPDAKAEENHAHCLCGGVASGLGDHTCDATTVWTPWTSTTTLPAEAGNYYLTENVYLSAMHTVAADINLCLNGKTVTTASGVANVNLLNLSAGYSLGICDCQYTENDGVYTFSGGLIGTQSNVSGAVLNAVGSGSVVNLYGGNLTVTAAASGTAAGTGGAVCLKYGVLNLYSAHISGGSANQGGNIYAGNSAVLNMYGGSVLDGTATATGAYAGGNLYIDGATVNLYGGIISGGEALGGSTSSGGNICTSTASGCRLNISGGIIQNGRSKNRGGNIYLNGGVMTMSGGRIVGGNATNASGTGDGVYVNSGGTLQISGTAYICENGTQNVYLYTGKTIAVSNLSPEAKIGVTLRDAAVGALVATGLTEDEAACFQYDNTKSFSLVHTDTGLLLREPHLHCFCGGAAVGGGLHNCVSGKYWTALSAPFTQEQLTNGGFFYLNKDLVITETIQIPAGTEIYLCLNGHSLESNGVCLFEIARNFRLCDCSYHSETGEFGGSMGYTAEATSFPDALIRITGSGKVYDYGAVITAKNANGGSRAIAMNGGALYLYNGTVTGGAVDGNGGTLLAENGGFVKIYGGVIADGSAEKGGNIFVSGETTRVVFQGGTVTGGSAEKGGNIYVANGAVLDMSGGELLEGDAIQGGNLFVGNGTVQMSGGSITQGQGGAYVSAEGVFRVSGTAKIYNNQGQNLTLHYGTTFAVGTTIDGVTVANVERGAKIGITYLGANEATAPAVGDVVATGLAEGQQIRFFYDGNAFGLVCSGTDLVLEHYSHKHCICGSVDACDGCDHSMVWTPWTSTTSLPTAAGNYYLTGNVHLTSTHTVTANINICLNGFTVTGNGRLLAVSGGYTLGISDCQYLYENGKYTFEGGLVGSAVNTTGLVINAANGATVNLYGGTLTATSAVSDALEATWTNNGGLVCLNSSTLNLYQANLSGGRAIRGGLVYGANSVINLYGGTMVAPGAPTVSGTLANNGGALYLSGGQLNVYATAISGGHANRGGNIYATSGTVMNIMGGSISGGHATLGGNSQGGNIYMTSAATKLNISGSAVIEGGVAKTNGGNIFLASGTVNLYGGTVANGDATGTSTSGGGNIYMSATSSYLNITGGTVSGGITKNRGGNIYANYGVIQMSGGKITGGKVTNASGCGDGVYVNSGASFQVSGTAYIYGNDEHNVYLYTDKTLSIGTTIDDITCSTLARGAKIGVTLRTAAAGTPVATGATIGQTPYFVSDNSAFEMNYEAGNVVMNTAVVHTIDSVEDLELLRQYPTGTFVIAANIDCGGMLWTPVDHFAGTITGVWGGEFNYTISNLVIVADEADTAVGLFRNLYGSVKDVNFANISLTTPAGFAGSAGVLAGNVDGDLSDIRATGLQVNLNGTVLNAGGLVGNLNGIAMNCYVDGTVTANISGGNIGGFAGFVSLAATNVESRMEMTIGGSANVGGVAGTVEGSLTNADFGGKMYVTAGEAACGAAPVAGRLNGILMDCYSSARSVTFTGAALETGDYYGILGQTGTVQNCFKRDISNLDETTMTPEELARRQKVVDYMYAMCTIAWTPSSDLSYVDSCGGVNHLQNYLAGQTYFGLPYTHKCGSLERMEAYIDANGVVDTSVLPTTGYNGWDYMLGNDCADAVFWSWSQVSSSVCYTFTENMIGQNGVLLVGDYILADNTSTKNTCKLNGAAVMYEAYAQIKMGDAILYGPGHVRMAAEAAYVYRNPDGSINPQKSYILTHEQGYGTLEMVERHSTCKVYGKYTFEKLFSSNYIPITVAELTQGESVETVTCDRTDFSVAGISTGTITSNYRINWVTVNIYDGETLVQTVTVYPCLGAHNLTYTISNITVLLDEATIQSGQRFELLTGVGDTEVEVLDYTLT